MLERMSKRGRGIDGREHLAARGFDVGLEPFDFAMRAFVSLRLRGQRGRRAIAIAVRIGSRDAPGGERRTRGLAPPLERRDLGSHGGHARS